MNNKKTIKFYVALWLAKLSGKVLKLLKRNATSFPGDLAIKICPNFLGMLEKPETIIGVTGTNGKTTVSNMIIDILTDNGYDLVNNKYGSNIDRGITTTLINAANLRGQTKKKLAVLEIDERSANKVYPYLTPNYLICTNIFRDSLMRNGHTEFIADILDKYIPKETIMVENARKIFRKVQTQVTVQPGPPGKWLFLSSSKNILSVFIFHFRAFLHKSQCVKIPGTGRYGMNFRPVRRRNALPDPYKKIS